MKLAVRTCEGEGRPEAGPVDRAQARSGPGASRAGRDGRAKRGSS
jgi:hypothetical protein